MNLRKCEWHTIKKIYTILCVYEFLIFFIKKKKKKKENRIQSNNLIINSINAVDLKEKKEKKKLVPYS